MRAVKLFLFVYLLVAFLSNETFARKVIKVGGYPFEPFVHIDGTMKAQGLTLELISLLNKSQTQYRFEFVATTARRRYRDFQEGHFDMMFFENPNWEWLKRGLPVEATHTFLEGGEVYIALNKSGRDQRYFNNFQGKRMAGMRGYHYGFAGFNANPTYLREKYNITLLDKNIDSIRLVLRDRVDIAVVTKIFLSKYLKENSDAQQQLLVSERLDQTYAHRILVRRYSAPNAKYIGKIIRKLEGEMNADSRKGPLVELWRRWGVKN
jgi:ABC-type amino acid transport substrate-binding protein